MDKVHCDIGTDWYAIGNGILAGSGPHYWCSFAQTLHSTAVNTDNILWKFLYKDFMGWSSVDSHYTFTSLHTTVLCSILVAKTKSTAPLFIGTAGD